MAVIVHVSNADPWPADRLKSSYDLGSSFSPLKVPTVTSCHEYIMGEVPLKRHFSRPSAPSSATVRINVLK